jgi:hypothetical protein
MTGIKQFNGIYTAKSPISHGSDEDFGMEQRLRTLEMEVEQDGERFHEEIPVISGNGLRGQLRDLLARDLLDRLDIEVHDKLLYALYAGGSLEKGTGGRKIKRSLIEDVRENLPMLSLLGTALGSQTIEGKLNMGMLTPIASETKNYTGIEAEKSVFNYVDDTFYTRSDDIEGYTDRDSDEQAQQMKFNIQVFTPGTRFHHRMTLRHCNEVEEACLYHAFDLFMQNPHIGGMQSKGHGRVNFQYETEFGSNDPYVEFIEENKEQIIEFLETLDEELEG